MDAVVSASSTSWLRDTDKWDGYLEGAESGWPKFFENLKSYLSS